MEEEKEKEAVGVLITKYKEMDCLWDTTHKYYGNKIERKKALEELLEIWKKDYPNTTLMQIKRKIECLRGSFRREWQKVKAAEDSGKKHYPKLWYFKKMQFLVHEDAPQIYTYYVDQNSEFTVQVEDENNEPPGSELLKKHLLGFKEEKDVLADETPQIVEAPASRRLATPSPVSIASDDLSTSSESIIDIKPTHKRKKRRLHASTSSKTSKTIEVDEGPPPKSKFEAYGQHIAEKLRSMAPKMAIYCQKIINDAIFMAETDDLDKSSYIVSRR